MNARARYCPRRNSSLDILRELPHRASTFVVASRRTTDISSGWRPIGLVVYDRKGAPQVSRDPLSRGSARIRRHVGARV